MNDAVYIDTPFEIKEILPSGAFIGLGSVYGNIDEGSDIVAPGAFAQSLLDVGNKTRSIKMLWQHRSGEPIGTYPQLKDTPAGLECHGKIVTQTQRGAEAHELMKAGAIDGLSIGGFTRADSYDQKAGVRTITQFELWEISVVTFPMNGAARIGAVKGIEEIGDLSGAELYLREAGGISRSEAKALVGRIAAVVRREAGTAQQDDASPELKAITQLLQRRAALLTA